MPNLEIQTMTYEEWHAKGQRLYGENELIWKFRCPSCGHVQCAEDFRPYSNNGDNAYFKCIGRFDGIHGNVPMGTKPGPCNYSGGGLFDLNPICVQKDGEEFRVFAFADE